MGCNPHCLPVRMPTLVIFWYDIPLKSLTNLPFTSGNQAPRMNKTRQVRFRLSAFFSASGASFPRNQSSFFGGFNPFEKYESQLGWWLFPTEWKVIKFHGSKPPTRYEMTVVNWMDWMDWLKAIFQTTNQIPFSLLVLNVGLLDGLLGVAGMIIDS